MNNVASSGSVLRGSNDGNEVGSVDQLEQGVAKHSRQKPGLCCWGRLVYSRTRMKRWYRKKVL